LQIARSYMLLADYVSRQETTPSTDAARPASPDS